MRQRPCVGRYWSFKSCGHVAYESRLELARLLLADIAPVQQRFAAQPMQLVGVDGSPIRRHVPDFLIVRTDDRPLVVDVKPAQFAARPEDAEVLRRTAKGHVPWGGVVLDAECHVVNVVSHRAMVSENRLKLLTGRHNARWLLTSLPSSSSSGN